MYKLIPVILLFFIVQNMHAQDPTTLVKAGDEAPDFEIQMEDGTVKKLSDLKGKVVWLNFFADWCPPCRKELPHLEKDVHVKFNGEAFEVLVIGREHDWATVNKFKKDNGYKMSFYPDPQREIFSKYAKQNIPRNFIIDKEGKIAVESTGYTEAEFEKLIEKLIALL